jgi:hypothetical protein
MSDDPRWAEVGELLDWFATNKSDPDPEEYLQWWRRYTGILEAIAGDRDASPDDRQTAQEILDGLTAHAKNYVGDSVAVLAAMANDDTAAHDVRAEARRVLARVAEDMRKDGTDISHWVGAPGAAKH